MHTKPLTLNPITWGQVATWVCLHWSFNIDGYRDAGCHCSWHWGHHHTNFICDWSLISLHQRECGSFLEVDIWKQRNSVWHWTSSWTGEYHIGGYQSQIYFMSTIHLVAVFLPVTYVTNFWRQSYHVDPITCWNNILHSWLCCQTSTIFLLSSNMCNVMLLL